jgi:hypothetical protein
LSCFSLRTTRRLAAAILDDEGRIIGDFPDRVADHRAYPPISAAYARLTIHLRSGNSEP